MVADLQPVPEISGRGPTVSIIVPVHNRATMVADVVASVRAQTYSDIELIIVDDGSDRDNAIVLDPADDAAIVIRKAHGGVSSARNLGFARSTGAYVVFLDSDDLLLADAIADMVRVLENSGAAYCVGRVFDADFDLERPRMSNDPETASSILHAAQWSTHASLYRRAVVEAAGPFDVALEIGEDVVFQTRAILHFGRGARCNSFVGVRRRHRFGHLSAWGRRPRQEACYIVAMANVIAGDDTFRRERFRDRLFWTISFLQRVLALGGDWHPSLVPAYEGIATTMMEDAPRLRGLCTRLAAHDRGPAARTAAVLLTAMRWSARAVAALRRRRHDRDIREASVRAALDRLRGTIGAPRPHG